MSSPSQNSGGVAGEVPVLGGGLEHDADVQEADPPGLGDDAAARIAQRAAEARQLLPQALTALLRSPVAPQLVLHPAPRPPVLRGHPEERQQALGLAPLEHHFGPVAPQQAHGTDQPQLQLVFVFQVFDHRTLSSEEMPEAIRKQAVRASPICAALAPSMRRSPLLPANVADKDGLYHAPGRTASSARCTVPSAPSSPT